MRIARMKLVIPLSQILFSISLIHWSYTGYTEHLALTYNDHTLGITW